MFIPRHPVVEDQFCSYAEQTGTGTDGVGGVVAYAGTVVYLDAGAINEEAMVKKMAYKATTSHVPFGFLMQKVKTGYHQVHPAGYYMPGDLGSSDVIAQAKYTDAGVINGTKAAPVGVAHLGIWDTVHYTCVKTFNVTSTVTEEMSPGAYLYAAADEGKVTNSLIPAADHADDVNLGKQCSNVSTPAATEAVAVVVKGASIAKCQANINNTTLYPIRIKLLV